MRKCDKCDSPAAVHLLEIEDGQTSEKHLCEQHAVDEGLAVKIASVADSPIPELLDQFVLKHSGVATAAAGLQCDQCGLTYEQFTKSALLGCPACYAAFAAVLAPLLERAHEEAHEHVGKVPRTAGDDVARQQRLMQLRRDLDEAVTNEQYERAAQLRDEVRQMEGSRA